MVILRKTAYTRDFNVKGGGGGSNEQSTHILRLINKKHNTLTLPLKKCHVEIDG